MMNYLNTTKHSYKNYLFFKHSYFFLNYYPVPTWKVGEGESVKLHFWTNLITQFTLLGLIFISIWRIKDPNLFNGLG